LIEENFIASGELSENGQSPVNGKGKSRHCSEPFCLSDCWASHLVNVDAWLNSSGSDIHMSDRNRFRIDLSARMTLNI